MIRWLIPHAFWFFARQQKNARLTDDDTHYITSFMFAFEIFRPRFIEAMGVFCTQGINMLKLEILYWWNVNFTATQFDVIVEAHFQSSAMQRLLERVTVLSARSARILGTYLANDYRLNNHDMRWYFVFNLCFG